MVIAVVIVVVVVVVVVDWNLSLLKVRRRSFNVGGILLE